MKFNNKNLVLLIIVFIVSLATINFFGVKKVFSDCPGGACPYQQQPEESNEAEPSSGCSGGACPYQQPEDSESESESESDSKPSKPSKPSGSSEESQPTSEPEAGKPFCCNKNDHSNSSTGGCLKPFCCCQMETLEELDQRIQSGGSAVDEPIGFIQKCRCKCYALPFLCQDDKECLAFPIDPYERATDHTVCGGPPVSFSYPQTQYSPNTKIDQPSFGSYTWEVGLPFFAKAEESTIFYPGSDVLAQLVGGFVKWMLRISGLIMFITFVYAGILYATSSGNPKQQKDAQQRMIDAVIGFFLLFGFYIILNTINPDILSSSPKLESFFNNNKIVLNI